MRILAVGNLFPPHDLGGGYELVWASAMAHARSKGHEVRILCSDHREPEAGPEVEPDVHRDLRWYWQDHEFPRRSALECLRLERHNAEAIARHVDAFRPDVFTWWSMGGMSLGLIEQVSRLGIPSVAFVHDDWLDYGRRTDAWHRRWQRIPRPIAAAGSRLTGVPTRFPLGDSTRYVFVSRRTRERARASGLVLEDAGVAHSGIEAGLIDPQPPREWGWRLLCVGRLDERKGLATAVDALPLLPEQATLTLVGSGDAGTVEALIDRAAALGVRDRVILAGRCEPDRVAAFYDESDVVVFPVLWEEPWGLVPLEAMARGRPVLATGRGGSGEYLLDERNCCLFAAGDAEELAAGVRRLSADPALRERLREGGLGTARDHTARKFDEAVLREAELAQSSGVRARQLP